MTSLVTTEAEHSEGRFPIRSGAESSSGAFSTLGPPTSLLWRHSRRELPIDVRSRSLQLASKATGARFQREIRPTDGSDNDWLERFVWKVLR